MGEDQQCCLQENRIARTTHSPPSPIPQSVPETAYYRLKMGRPTIIPLLTAESAPSRRGKSTWQLFPIRSNTMHSLADYGKQASQQDHIL